MGELSRTGISLEHGLCKGGNFPVRIKAAMFSYFPWGIATCRPN